MKLMWQGLNNSYIDVYRTVLQRKYTVAKKHIVRCAISLVIRKLQIKTTMRYCFTYESAFNIHAKSKRPNTKATYHMIPLIQNVQSKQIHRNKVGSRICGEGQLVRKWGGIANPFRFGVMKMCSN